MQKHLTSFLLALTLVVFIPTIGLAAARVTLETTIEKREIVITNGKEEIRFIPSDQAAPGDQLRFTLSFSNKGDEIANGVVLDNPIPANAVYVAESASTYKGSKPMFSINDGATYDESADLLVEQASPDGSKKMVTASPEKYTHIRWRLPALPAGSAGQVSFNVLIQ